MHFKTTGSGGAIKAREAEGSEPAWQLHESTYEPTCPRAAGSGPSPACLGGHPLLPRPSAAIMYAAPQGFRDAAPSSVLCVQLSKRSGLEDDTQRQQTSLCSFAPSCVRLFAVY